MLLKATPDSAMHSYKHLYVLLILVIIVSISLSDDTLNEEVGNLIVFSESIAKSFHL